MRFLRYIYLVRVISGLIALGICIIALLFWDERDSIKKLLFFMGMILFFSLYIASHISYLKKEKSFYRNNEIRKIQLDKLAFHERQRINQQRDGIPGQIDAKLHKVLTSNLIYFRMLRSKVFIILFIFSITYIIFWGIFNFRSRLSLILSLITGFIAGEIWQIIIRYRIAAIFDKEFPTGSTERIDVIEHLNENSHAYWFAPELLKVVTNHSRIYK